MIYLRELIDELGGGKSVGLGALLVLLLYLAASNYVSTIEERLDRLSADIERLEKRQATDDIIHGTRRLPASEGAALRQRVERLERLHEKEGK